MWVNVFVILFLIYAAGCYVASLCHLCAMNRQLEDHWDKVMKP